MRKILPHPVLTLILLGLWLLLNNSLALGQVLLGLLLALIIPIWLHPALNNHMGNHMSGHLPIRKPMALLGYIAIVLKDIVVANFIVAKQVIGPNHVLKPHFLDVPLDLTHPTAISLFASTITLTPGTVSCELSEDGRVLRVHALHTLEPTAEIEGMKHRYERRLIDIFGAQSTADRQVRS